MAGEIKETAGVDHGLNVAQRLELIDLAGLVDFHGGGVEIDGDGIAGLKYIAEALGGFAGVEFAGGDAIAEEDAGETFGDDDAGISRSHGDGGVLAGTAATEILAGDDDGVLGIHLALFDEALRIERVGQSTQRIAAELLVFLLDGGNEVQILRGNDLVGVDIILHHVDRTCKNGLHKSGLICCGGRDKSNSFRLVSCLRFRRF